MINMKAKISLKKIRIFRLSKVALTFNLITGETDTWESLWVWGQPNLDTEFQDSQDYKERPCLHQPQNI